MARPGWAVALACLWLASGVASAAEETRAYHGLWGSLFKQQPAPAPAPPGAQPSGLHSALAQLQSRLWSRLGGIGAEDGAGTTGGSQQHHVTWAGMEQYLQEQLDGLLGLGSTTTEPDVGAAPQPLNDPSLASALGLPSLTDGNWSAADAQRLALHAWALGTLMGGGGAAAGGLALHAAAAGGAAANRAAPAGGGLSGGLSGGLGGLEGSGAGPVASPRWDAFKPHTCMRLQNFADAEGFNNVLLGPAPCSARAPGTAAVPAGGPLRWAGGRASFLLDCSRGGGDGEASASSGGADSAAAAAAGFGGSAGVASTSGLVSGMLHAASQAASKAAAAIDTRRTCHLAVTSARDGEGDGAAAGGTGGQGGASSGSESGSAAHLRYSFEAPLIGAPKLDALKLRLCNLPPSTQQYPAALARGPTILLTGLKLNGRPLLQAPVAAPQAAAASGCLSQLYRINSKATRGGFVLSGWVVLAEGASVGPSGGSSSAGGLAAALPGGVLALPAGGFGVGEMASVELTLGEYSLLDAAASRLLSGAAGVAQAGAGVGSMGAAAGAR